MSLFVYILYSDSLQMYYTGFSKYRYKRQRQHRGRKSASWTLRADDWLEVFIEQVASVAEARKLEKRIKARGARRFLLDRGIVVSG